MSVRLAHTPQDQTAALAWLESQPHASLWQSSAWRDFQQSIGRQVRLYVEEEAGLIIAAALVIIDRTAFGLSVWDIPRGPVGSFQRAAISGRLLQTIIEDARKNRCLTLFASPQVTLQATSYKLIASHRHIHPDATRVLDLTLTDEALLAQMKQKGRYNIRLAERHGVRIERSTDAAAFARLAATTGKRDGFTPHNAAFYERFLQHLAGSFLLLAYPADSSEPIAGLMGVTWHKTGIYYYGASSHDPAARPLMAPYLLQWNAMRLCRSQGCTQYDLFGVAPEGAIHHPWSGVTDFKEKFGGRYIAYEEEQELVLRPFTKTILDLKRKFLG